MTSTLPPMTPEAKEREMKLAKELERAKAHYASLSSVDKAIHDLMQRQSWATGEMRMNDDASPSGVTEEQAKDRLRNIAPEYIILDELFRLRKKSFHRDVGAFHEKFELPTDDTVSPRQLDTDVLLFRVNFLIEELAEFMEACGLIEQSNALRSVGDEFKTRIAHFTEFGCDLEKAGDALVDLVYVACGTAHLMGLPFDEMWAEVQRANMEKERATSASDGRSKRAHRFDVVKPAGWTPPDHKPIIARAMEKFKGGSNEG